MTTNIEIRHFTAEQAAELRPTLLDVYREVYADSIAGDSFSGVQRFARGLDGWSSRPGWTCTVGYDGDQVVGFAYGAPLPEGAAWWRGLLNPVPEHVVRETGTRTYAISELMVRVPWRKTGVSRRLHDELLADRNEGRATLLVRSSHPKVQALYESWGWKSLGQLIPRIENAPKFDAMLLKLPHTGEEAAHTTGSAVLDRIVTQDNWETVLRGNRLREPSRPRHVLSFHSAEGTELIELNGLGMMPVPDVGKRSACWRT
ncbi:GNAT family N-acetyltransferase [Streptomyces scabichelini]|uniref:GNAT family N-acetyltransferase n=1 Tax=Streptomyces scabichelini TaxID=2711217 RepID=UPI0019D00883|nr:GNAT family N-acetyltransferase [Streptomyces scabichelini]